METRLSSFQEILNRILLYDLKLPNDVDVIDQLTKLVHEDFETANIPVDVENTIFKNKKLMNQHPPNLSFYNEFKKHKDYPRYINALTGTDIPSPGKMSEHQPADVSPLPLPLKRPFTQLTVPKRPHLDAGTPRMYTSNPLPIVRTRRSVRWRTPLIKEDSSDSSSSSDTSSDSE